MFCVSKFLQNNMEPKILITGTGRGLGKFLFKEFSKLDIQVNSFTRENTSEEITSRLTGTLNQSYDMIIHCAANVSHATWEDDLPYSYFNDNIFLTKDIVSIPHKRFIHISSIAAAPGTHTVDEHKTSPYGISKRISESIIKEFAKDYQIIRPTGLLGVEMKTNTFQKILQGSNIVLSADSIMNYVLYEDVLDMINSNLRGIITLCANSSITMKEVAKLVNKDIQFGKIYFDINSDIFKSLTKNSSADNIKRYINKYEK